MYFELAIIFILTYLLYYFGLKKSNEKINLPPGPKNLPLIGSLLELSKYKDKTPYILLQQLAKKYGKVMSLKAGMSSQVVVEDLETMKEILCSEIWIERIYDNYWAERSFGKILGILFVSGDNWKEMRRFALRTLRDFGFGRHKSMEEVLNEELRDFFETINKNIDSNNGLISVNKFFTVSVLNILWSLMAGERFSHEDKRCKELVNLMDLMMKNNAVGTNIYQMFPFLWYIVPAVSKARRDRKMLRKKLFSFLSEIMEERRQDGRFMEDQRDFIDVFLKEIDNAKKNPHLPNSKYYTDEQFVVVCLDLFAAGSETTSNTIEFAILFSMLNPEVQKRVQMEIDKVVGRSRFPNAMDRINMPYTEAVILEVQRMGNVVPIIIRTPTENTKLGKYDIPKGTIGVLNMHSLHLSKEIWDDPEVFRPERFLDKERNNVINSGSILPFGMGKRLCLGESMAKTTLFTYYTAILQNYSILKVPSQPEPSCKPVLGFTQSPVSFEAIFKPR